MTFIQFLFGELDDLMLVKRVLNRDEEAIKIFERRFTPPIKRLAGRWPPWMYEHHGAVEDLVASAFYFLILGIRRTKGVREPSGYSSNRPPLQDWHDESLIRLEVFIYQRVQTYYRDLYRQIEKNSKRELSSLSECDELLECPKHAHHPSDVELEWEKVEIRRVVDDVLSKLPFAHRTILLLRNDSGRTFEEIAAQFHISESSAMRHYQKALEIFEEQLKLHYPSVYTALRNDPP